jgi:two-component system repressor protein LuxO
MSVAQQSESVAVLIVDADPAQRRTMISHLESRRGRFVPLAVETVAEAAAIAGRGNAGILLADVDTVGGPDRLAELARGATPVIATSSGGSLHAAVNAMRAGAVDYLAKPVGAAALIERLEAAIARWQTRMTAPMQQSTNPEAPAGTGDAEFHGFIGGSPPMLRVYDQIRRIAPSRAPVFITGESGTGKEVCARAIHALSGPEGRPFVAINCSALPKDLIESEIFGHARGAFTGAVESRPGAAELAHGGTLLLDEIGEMDLGLQAKLLRFVQTGMIRRVGGVEEKAVDVRFVCATNRDPLVEVREGRFRQDLFYRLNVLPIALPALRERPDDILPLAESFLRSFSREEGRAFRGFDPTAAALLRDYPWPGNVRQLQNVVRRIVVLYDEPEVTPAMLPPEIAAAADAWVAADAPQAPGRLAPFWMQERNIIEAALSAFGGNISRAAAALEISPSTIYRKRQAWAEKKAG